MLCIKAEVTGHNMAELQANLYKGIKKLKSMATAPLKEEEAHLI